MKIALFGGSGRTGREFLMQALEQGHEIHALVRNPERLGIVHENLYIVKGDAENRQDVFRTIQQTEAVVLVLGHTKSSSKTILEKATAHVLAAMHEYQVKRIVSLTGATVKAPKDQHQKFVSRFAETLMRTFARELLGDSMIQKNMLEISKLDWTIIRAPRLLDGPLTGHYRTGYFVFEKPMIARADVAHFILSELASPQYVNEYPLIGN